jgi:hypothetical protein
MAARRAACGDGGASEAGEDGAEEDGEEADARRMGRRSPGGGGADRGGGAPEPPTFQGLTAADRQRGGGEGVGGSVDGGFREAGSGGESRGAEDGGCHGRRRLGRMTATAEEDTTTTMAVDRG